MKIKSHHTKGESEERDANKYEPPKVARERERNGKGQFENMGIDIRMYLTTGGS
jgi:hypothetical protein